MKEELENPKLWGQSSIVEMRREEETDEDT